MTNASPHGLGVLAACTEHAGLRRSAEDSIRDLRTSMHVMVGTSSKVAFSGRACALRIRTSGLEVRNATRSSRFFALLCRCSVDALRAKAVSSSAMAPKITPKPQPRRRQPGPGGEKPAVDGASSSATATQVPSPLRPAVTRLESIAGGPPVPGTAKAPLKYKPTGIARRTKEERDRAEREEQERLAARAITTPLATGAG